MVSKEGERIQKVIASTGMASRREAESWIAEGRVSVNGKVVVTGAKVSAQDRIMIDGKPLRIRQQKNSKIIAYHNLLVKFAVAKIQQAEERCLNHCQDFEVVVGSR